MEHLVICLKKNYSQSYFILNLMCKEYINVILTYMFTFTIE